MKRFLSTKRNEHFLDIAILILRVSIGVFMLIHGWPKFQKLLGDGPIKFPDPLHIGATFSLILTVFAEVLCSVFIILGLGTRLGAFPLFITMLVAVLVVHSGDSFSDRESALQYLLVYLVLLVSGGGRYSIDKMMGH